MYGGAIYEAALHLVLDAMCALRNIYAKSDVTIKPMTY